MTLVVGATGLVGFEVCRRLRATGQKVRALVRCTSAPEKIDQLRSLGVELCGGDLKDCASLNEACRGVTSVISTASATVSQQAGDSILSVDRDGQLNLVAAAKSRGIDRFIFVSFRHGTMPPFPLDDAKREVEAAIADMNFTVIQASWFMEVWLSPALGFDYENRRARIYGPGLEAISWVSALDVAEMCALALHHPSAQRRTIEFGGPEALTPLQVVAAFEQIGGQRFQTEHVPEAALRAQYESATDPMQKTFAALMLGTALGDAIDMTGPISEFGLSLTSVADYARTCMSRAKGDANARATAR